MCDCRERLLKEAHDYIKHKMSQLNVKNYLKTYDDISQLLADVDGLQNGLDAQRRSILGQFEINGDVIQKVNNALSACYDEYGTITDPDYEFVGQLEAGLQQNQKSLNILEEKVQYIRALIQCQEHRTQEQFKAQLQAKLDQQESQYNSIQLKIAEVQSNLEQRKSQHQFMESRVRAIELHQKGTGIRDHKLQ